MAPETIADPETDPTATYAVDPGLVRRLTERVVCAARPATLLTHTPMTGAPLAALPLSTPDDVRVAYAGARAAQRSWARLPVEHRERVVLRFHDLVLERQRQLLDLIQLESGKARVHAFEEVADTAMVSRHYGRRARRLPAPAPAPGRVPGADPLGRAAPPQGRRRHRRAVELPAVPVDHRRDPRAAGRQRRRPAPRQPVGPDRAAGGRAAGGGRAARAGAAGRARRPGDRRGRPGRGRLRLLHRLHRDGPRSSPSAPRERLVGASLELGGKNAMYVAADADLPRAVRGRRPRLLLLGRAAVHLGRAAATSTRTSPRSSSRAFVARHPGAAAGRRPGLRRRHGLPVLRGPAGAGHARTSRTPAARARGSSPAAGTAPTSAPSSTSRPSWPTSPPPWPAATRRRSGRSCRSTASAATRRPSPWPTTATTASTPRSGPGTRARGRRLAAAVQAGTVNVNDGYAAAWAQHRRADGRDEELGAVAAARRRGHPQVHRVPDRRGPAPGRFRRAAAGHRRAVGPRPDRSR